MTEQTKTMAEVREMAAGIRGEAEALQDSLFTLLTMCIALEGLAEGRRKPHDQGTAEKAVG